MRPYRRRVATLTDDMKRMVAEQRLGFYATVCPDGTPNVSPKGTTCVWDDSHICFGAIRSPRTVENIRAGSQVEINVVDPVVRKGYRFKGPAVVHECGTAPFFSGLELLRHAGVRSIDRIRSIVVVEVQRARAIVSPIYDDGTMTEEDVAELYRQRVLSNTA